MKEEPDIEDIVITELFSVAIIDDQIWCWKPGEFCLNVTDDVVTFLKDMRKKRCLKE